MRTINGTIYPDIITNAVKGTKPAKGIVGKNPRLRNFGITEKDRTRAAARARKEQEKQINAQQPADEQASAQPKQPDEDGGNPTTKTIGWG